MLGKYEPALHKNGKEYLKQVKVVLQLADDLHIWRIKQYRQHLENLEEARLEAGKDRVQFRELHAAHPPMRSPGTLTDWMAAGQADYAEQLLLVNKKMQEVGECLNRHGAEIPPEDLKKIQNAIKNAEMYFIKHLAPPAIAAVDKDSKWRMGSAWSALNVAVAISAGMLAQNSSLPVLQIPAFGVGAAIVSKERRAGRREEKKREADYFDQRSRLLEERKTREGTDKDIAP